MEKLIHDQIEESNGSSEIRNALLESALLGTGIMKGPFNLIKNYISGIQTKKVKNLQSFRS